MSVTLVHTPHLLVVEKSLPHPRDFIMDASSSQLNRAGNGKVLTRRLQVSLGATYILVVRLSRQIWTHVVLFHQHSMQVGHGWAQLPQSDPKNGEVDYEY